MSVRVYSGPHTDRRRGGSGGFARMLPWILAVVAILSQIAWPLTTGATRDALTLTSVVLFFLTSAVHALTTRGPLWTLGWLVISGGIGFLAELAGTRTGLPFGDYAYASDLGPVVAGVPVVIPLAWAMMSYPALLAARRLRRGRRFTPLVAAVALASWDLFLDPQMVTEGRWTWTMNHTLTLRGIEDVPVMNFVGWLIVALLVMLVLNRLPRRRSDGAAGDGVPALMFVWTYVSCVVLNAVFLHRPGVALWGGVAMGLVAIPYMVVLWTARD